MFSYTDVINHLLGVVGIAPVTSDASNHPSVLSAKVQIDKTNLAVQSTGWWFNTETGLTLLPNVSGEIVLPSTTLKIDKIVSGSSNLVRRGSKLYDKKNHTYNIGGSVVLDLILFLPWDELPVEAQAYIQARAAVSFLTNEDGDLDKVRILGTDVAETRAALREAHMRNLDVSALDSPQAYALTSRLNWRS